MKKIISLLLITIICFSSFVVFADKPVDKHKPGEDEVDIIDITPYSVAPCSHSPNGRHWMYPRGSGVIREKNPDSGNGNILEGNAYVCEHCDMFMVSQIMAEYGLLGRYSEFSAPYRISWSGGIGYVDHGTTLEDLPVNTDLQSQFSLYWGYEWRFESTLD